MPESSIERCSGWPIGGWTICLASVVLKLVSWTSLGTVDCREGVDVGVESVSLVDVEVA